MTDEPLTEPTLITLEACPSAVVKHSGVTMADLRPLFDNGFAAIATSGAAITGPAFAIYRGEPAGRFDLELGFPVSEPLAVPVAGEVTVEPSQPPAGRALAVSHLGAYDELPASWSRLGEEASRRGLEPTGWYEVYVTEPTPEVDPSTLRSDLFLLV